jgi:hypothetical protein
MDTESGVSFPTTWSLTPPPQPVNLSLLAQDKDENWARKGKLPFSGFRKATEKTQFHFPRGGQRSKSTADEWIRLTTGEKWTNASLGYVADMWPMPVEAYLHSYNPYDIANKDKSKPAKFWYPTLLLNLEIKKTLPEEGVEWLFVRVDTKQIQNGRLDLDIVVMDEGGEIVATSQHVAFVVDAERNLAERKTGAGSKI